MKATLNDLLNAKGVSEPLREAAKALIDHLEAAYKEIESWKGLARQFGNEADELRTHLSFAKDELNLLRAKIAEMEKQEPYAFAVNFPESSRVELVHDLDEAYEDMTYEAYEVRKLYLAPGAKGE